MIRLATGMSILGLGSMTLRRRDVNRGLEADQCYYIRHEPDVRGKQIDLAVDFPPDLAIEVEISRSALNRMGIYASLRVPEIWRYNGEKLSVNLLNEQGNYIESSVSLSFPFFPMDVLEDFFELRENG